MLAGNHLLSTSSALFDTAMWCCGSVGWLILVINALRSDATQRRRMQQGLLLSIALCGVLVAPLQDVFSDDARRYVWDGIVVASGDNPYASAPLREPLITHRLTLDDGITLPDDMPYATIPTIYPPGMQLVVGSIVAILGTPTLQTFHIVWWIFIALLAAAAIFSTQHHDRIWILLALLSPVVLLHGLADIHSDTAMALIALLGLIALRRDRLYLAAILIALAISIKYVPVILLPALFLRRPRRMQVQLASVVVATLVVVYAPFLTNPRDVLGALPVFAEHWQANSLLYALFGIMDASWLTSNHIRIMLAATALALCSGIWWRYRTQPLVAAALGLIALLLCSPVVHAWYIMLPLMLLPVAPLRSTITWAATMCIYGFFYTTYKGDGVWFEHPVALAFEFIPVVVAFVRDVQRGPLLLRDEQRTRDATVAQGDNVRANTTID